MNFEDLKIIWDSESERPSYTLDEEALHRIVRKRSHSFWKKILFRDSIEIGVAIVLVWQFSRGALRAVAENGGEQSPLSVSLFLMTMGVAFVGLFLFVSRQRQKKREKHFDESIQGNLQKLHSNVSHQIRLLSLVAWWYLLPLVPGVILFIVATADEGEINPWLRGLIVAVIFSGIFWLNLRAVRTNLRPEQQELESLLVALQNGGQDNEVRSALTEKTPLPPSRRIFAMLLALGLFAVGWILYSGLKPVDEPLEPGFGTITSIGQWLLGRSVPGGGKPASEHGFAKVAPFTGVRWEKDRPVVQVEGRWYPLVSIDGISVDRLMEFANEEYGQIAHKRFAEDLPEVLSTMGHDPDWEVTLGLEGEDGQVELRQIQMTKYNRNLVRKSINE